MKSKVNNPLGRAFIYLINKLWLLLATVIILIAVGFSLLRVFLPQINYFKDSIVSQIEETYQVEIEVGRIDAQWGALGPIISARDFNLKLNDDQLNLISVDAFSIHIDGLKSLMSKTLTTENINISGASINFIIDRKLGVHFDTLEKLPGETSQNEIQEASRILLSSMFGQKYLTLTESEITIETLSGREFFYNIDELSIRNFDQIHQLKGELFDQSEGRLKLVAEIFGDPSNDDSHTNLYLEGRGIELTRLPVFENQKHLKPDQGVLSWRLWSDWRGNRWQTAVGDIQLSEVAWLQSDNADESADKSVDIARINEFTGQFNWYFENENQGVFSLHDVSLKKETSENNQIPDLYFLYNQNEKYDLRWDLVTHGLQIEPLVEYLDVIFNSKGSNEGVFKHSGLKLAVDSLAIRFFKQQGVWYLPEVITDFSGLSYQKLGDIPHFNGTSGVLSYANGFGSIDLSGENLLFDFDDLFRNVIEADFFDASINWQLDDKDQIDLVVDSVYVKNKDLTLNAKGRFFYQDQRPILSLYAELADLDASRKSLYLPTGIMSSSLTSYLDNSIKSGTLSTVKAVVNGPLDSFPFPQQEGLFSILGVVEGATYQYLPDWPMAEALNARLLFEGNRMDIEASAGYSVQNKVNYARAVIDDLTVDNPLLQLSLDVKSSDNSGREFLLQSPLNGIGESLEIIYIKGGLTTSVELAIGLEDEGLPKVTGQVIPDRKNAIASISTMQLQDINGVVNFDQNGVVKSRLTTRYHGETINAEIIGADNNHQSALLINLEGMFDAVILQDFVAESWTEFAHGKAHFNSQVLVSPAHETDKTLINVTSDLQGIEINLPGELGKKTADKTPFDLQLSLGSEPSAFISWQQVKGHWEWKTVDDGIEITGGVFQHKLDEPLAEIIDSSVSIRGNFGKLSLPGWSKVLMATKDEYQDISVVELPDIKINLSIEKLDNPAVALEDVNLSITKPGNKNWNIDFKSQLGSGSLIIDKSSPWQLKVDNLNLDFKPEFYDASEQDLPLNNWSNDGFLDNPLIWPEVDLECKNCTFMQREMGNIVANLRHQLMGLKITGNAENEAYHHLTFALEWLRHDIISDSNIVEFPPESEHINQQKHKTTNQLTTIEYQLKTKNVGNLMAHWQKPVAIEDSDGTVSGRVWWDKKPWEIEPERIEGDAHFRFGKGYLSDINDAKAHLLSLFNFQLLSKRLKLDFKDVFKKGFFYDHIEGDVVARKGVIFTNNVFIDGNAAKVDLAGSIDLNNELIEQEALITPQLTSSLPVLVGWAVEPATGLLVYLLNKIMEPAIDVVTQVEYRIHGHLDDIKVDQVSRNRAKVKFERESPKENDTDLKGEQPIKSNVEQ